MIRNINLGRETDRTNNPGERWAKMAKIALGQYKMVRRPVSGIVHVIVYIGFIIINIEVLEIIIDGIFGTHRIFAFAGAPYRFLIAAFEILAFLVLVGVIIFWIRRNILIIRRFRARELTKWPKNDANYILYFEMVLMSLFLIMNAADYQLQLNLAPHYAMASGEIAGAFPISSFLLPLLDRNKSCLLLVKRNMTHFDHQGLLFIQLFFQVWDKSIISDTGSSLWCMGELALRFISMISTILNLGNIEMLTKEGWQGLLTMSFKALSSTMIDW